jgi:hypothetical protein
MMADNPFRGLTPRQIYDLLRDPSNDLPQWPSKEVQRGITATSGPGAVRKAQSFIDMLDKDGAFVPDWKGLDYGAGWGRIASLLLSKGSPEQLDLVDAMDRSLALLEAARLKNRRWKVSMILKPGEIPENTYNFIYAFSVFTHLGPRAFFTNLEAHRRGVRSGGTVYFTVRHPEFATHRYSEKTEEISRALDEQGFWFTPTAGGGGIESDFGRMIITEERLRESFAPLEYLGTPLQKRQHVYALRV